jgi:hypothetical protein
MPAPEDFESWWTVVKLLQKDQELNTKRTALAAAELNQSIQATYLPGQTRSWLSKATHKRLIAKEVIVLSSPLFFLLTALLHHWLLMIIR